MTRDFSDERQDALEILAKLYRAEEELALTRTQYEQYLYNRSGSGVYRLRTSVNVVLVLLGLAGVSFAAYTWLVAVLPPRSALGASVVLVVCAACILAIILARRLAQRQSYRNRLKNELELSREIERQLHSAAEWLNKALQRTENTSESSYVR